MCFIVTGKGCPRGGNILNFLSTNLLHIISRLLPDNFVDIHYQWPEILWILRNFEYWEVGLPQDEKPQDGVSKKNSPLHIR